MAENNIPILNDSAMKEALNKAKENQEQNKIKEVRTSKNIENIQKTQDEKIDEQNKDIAARRFDVREYLIFDILEKESKKEEPREKMKNIIIYFSIFQLAFLALLIIGILMSKGFFGAFSDKVFLELINFLKFYITMVVAEFIAMIFFIVKFIYNTKLIDILEKWFKDI